MPNRHVRGTIPQTQSHEKTLPSRGRQTSAAPGQEAFLTPYLTTVRTGTRGNSGFKSVKKYLIPIRKCRKALQITIKNLVQAFGSKMPGVRVSPLGPKCVDKRDTQQKYRTKVRYFCILTENQGQTKEKSKKVKNPPLFPQNDVPGRCTEVSSCTKVFRTLWLSPMKPPVATTSRGSHGGLFCFFIGSGYLVLTLALFAFLCWCW